MRYPFKVVLWGQAGALYERGTGSVNPTKGPSWGYPRVFKKGNGFRRQLLTDECPSFLENLSEMNFEIPPRRASRGVKGAVLRFLRLQDLYKGRGRGAKTHIYRGTALI